MVRNNSKPEPSQQQGISLDELAQAFAQVMGTAPKLRSAAPPSPPAADGPEESAETQQPEQALATAAEEPATSEEDSCPISPRSILEAMLFVGNGDNQSLSANRAAELMRDVQAAEISGLVDELNERYVATDCPYRIVHEGGGYRMALGATYRKLSNRFYRRIHQARLSQAAVDVLAIVAYQQPLTADQISKLRGKPSSHVLAQLVHRGLLRLERLSGKRRGAQYHTTDRFLQLFGLESLRDLPQSEDAERQ
jgi:segregation and condensation protein B